MEAKATAKYVRMAPRKVRFVMDTIRGKYANDALAQLKFTPNHAAAEIAKVLQSAVANAENNFNLNPDALKVARCYVDGGPTLKRVQPRAQGRAYRILKRTSHITVVVEEADLPPRQKTGAREVEIKQKARQRPPLRATLATSAAAAPAQPVAEDTAPAEEATTVVGDASEAAPNNAAASNDATTSGEQA